jgi:phosphonate transport system substrate-binding protein
MKYGEDPNHFFGHHIITRSHDRSFQAVADGFVDGAAVHGFVYDQMMEENPSILDKVRILSESPPFSIPPIVVNPALDPKLRQATLSVLLKMDQDEQGKKILKKLRIEKFVVPQKEFFDSIRNEVSKLERWK